MPSSQHCIVVKKWTELLTTYLCSSTLPEPLVISLTNGDGTPGFGQQVVFRVTENNGVVSGSGEARALVLTTDVFGKASVRWTLGTRAGSGNNKVEATAVGYNGTAIFSASATLRPPDKINVASGNNQSGEVGIPLAQPLVAIVTDEGHNAIPDVPVTFQVAAGGGSFDGAPSVTINTDNDGRVAASLTLGQDGGFDNNVVEASFPGLTGLPATFVASGFVPGDPGDTKVSGVVLDNSNNPIPGVTMRLAGTTREAVVDAEGQFMIENVSVGPITLIADGGTATVPGTYPTLMFEIDAISGQNNTLGMPTYLLPLNTENTATVGGNEDVVYTLDEVPGFSLTVKAGSVTFPNGSRQGQISVTQVHADKVPMTPPNGLQPQFVITIQPPGVLFEPPAPITLPNVDGLQPGEVTDLYSFDHDLKQFVVIGTGTVSGESSGFRLSENSLNRNTDFRALRLSHMLCRAK